MKCANLHAIGDLRYDEIPMPVCGEDEVLVQVKFCGICGSDLPRVYTKGTYRFPTVIGHEFSGLVVEDATGEYTGKKVAVFPLLPCFACPSCKSQHYATCQNYDYYGSRCNGGMSQYLAVKRWNLLPVPESLSYEEAAMCEPVAVARHAALKLQLRPKDNLLITGAGPIGLLVGQWAKHFGAAQVYYFDIDPRKLELCEKLGFGVYREGIRIHCGLEGTGYGNALGKCLEAVTAGGRLVLMGNPTEAVSLPQDIYWEILRKELTLCGTWNSDFRPGQNDWLESLNAMATGTINAKALISHVYPLAQVQDAFAMMKNRTAAYTKVLVGMEVADENR